MSPSLKVCVLYVPGEWNDAWLESLRTASSDAGWDFVDACGPSPSVNAQVDTLIVSFDVNAAKLLAPDVWCVLHASPASVLSYLTRVRGRAQTEAQNVWEASHRLAGAAELAAAGATVLDAGDSELCLPCLGVVKRNTGGGGDLPSSESGSPLDGYRILPLVRGAEFQLPLAMCISGDGKKSSHEWVDLTGRGRLIVGVSPMDLPSGGWRAEIRFSLDNLGAALPFRWEWGDDTNRSAGVFRGEKPGRYAFSVDHYLEDVSPTMGQLLLSYPVFQGSIRLDGITITRLPSEKIQKVL